MDSTPLGEQTHWEVDVLNWSRLSRQKAGSELPDSPVVVEECEAHYHGEPKGDGGSYHDFYVFQFKKFPTSRNLCKLPSAVTG
jgi:hypothetical protein